MKLKYIIYFVVLSLFWGGSFLAIHYVIEGLPIAFGALSRVTICLIAVSVLMLFKSRSDTPKNIKLQAFCAGIVNIGIPWLLLFYAEKFVSPALGAIYNSSTTIFVALFTPIFLSHIKLIRKNIIGIAIGFIGILIVFWPKISARDINQISSQISLIGMTICYALGTLWIKRFSGKINAVEMLFYLSMGGFSVLGIYSVLFEAPWNIGFSGIHLRTYMAVLYLGICSTFLAWLIYIKLIHQRGAVQAAAVLYVVPLISIILDWLILKKVVSLIDIIGVFVILAGMWLIQKKPKTIVFS